MYRILLILVLLLLLYFLIRSAIRELKARSQGRQVLDKNQMVQDPVCRVFVPKGSAVIEEIGGQTYFFCSRSCAQKFERQLSG